MSVGCNNQYNGENRREYCYYADQAANRAVKKTFAIVGVDIDNPKDVEQFRQDLRFGSSLRKAAGKGRMALWLSFCSATGYAIFLGVKHFLKG